MTSKKSKSSKSEDFKKQDVLQAVIIADSFDKKFTPVTLLKPRALLPLANIPLLEYTLEFLASSGIQEIIVFCCAHATAIKDYLKRANWLLPSSPVKIITVVSEDCLSFGDALRDIDAKSLISSDFVLVNGDTVANVKLKPILAEHKERRLKDKQVMMTMLFKKAPPYHMIRQQQADVLLAIKSDDNRLLHYEKSRNKKKFHMPLELFMANRSVQLRYDLLDTGVTICSPHTLELFTDNFDYLTKDDFVKGLLSNEEVMANKMYIHVLDKEYAARVSNLPMYNAVSKDVLSRWVYPVVPDGTIADISSYRYSYGRHNIYLHRNVTLARGCTLQQNVLIGEGTEVKNDTFITDSIIGKNCVIGNNVKLDGAYIWDNVHIDDGCELMMCLIDNKVHLKNNVKVQNGCVIASEVVVGNSVTLSPGCRLTTRLASGNNDVVGKDGQGCIFSKHVEDDDEDVDNLTEEIWGMKIDSEEDEGVEDTDLLLSDSDDDYNPSQSIIDDEGMFLNEVINTLEKALTVKTDWANVVLEVNSVKHAYGIQIKQVNQLLTKAIITLPLKPDTKQEAPDYLKQLTTNFKIFLPLLSNYIRSEESQMDCINSIEECCLAKPALQKVIVKVLHQLYEDDILSEEVILSWHKSVFNDDEMEADRKNIRKQVEPLVRWLNEAEEESD